MFKGIRATPALFALLTSIHRETSVRSLSFAAGAVLTVLASLCNFTVLGDRGQAPQTPTFSSRVTLVPLDVRVLDRNGKPVAELGKDDFTVTEEGVPQQITHFERQSLVPSDPSASAPLTLDRTGKMQLAQQGRRVFVIVLQPPMDWLPPVPPKIVEAITRFLRERLLPQDYAALFAMRHATDLTTNHDAVALVLERLREYQRTQERKPDFDRRTYYAIPYMTALRPDPPPMQADLDEIFRPAAALPRSPPLVTGREMIRLLGRIESHMATISRDAATFGLATRIANRSAWNVYNSIEWLRYIEGEKHLIYFASGGIRLPDVQDDRDLARLASDARVVIHVVTAGTFDLWASMSSKNAAQLTGGHAFVNQYPDRALARIEETTRVGYLLGYYPRNATLDGRYRALKVTVKRPPGATVLYRHSYRATADALPNDPLQFMAQDRIMGAAEYATEIRDVTVRLEASMKRETVTAEAAIDFSRIALQRADGRHAGTVEVAFFCLDSKQRVIGQVWKKIDLKLKEDTYQRLLKEGLRHTADIAVTGPPRYVKVVVYDYVSDRLGTTIVALR